LAFLVGQYELCLACNLKQLKKRQLKKAIVAEALARPNSLNNSIKCVGDTAADPAVSHTLIQIESNPPYYEKRYKYGSVYIAEQVYQKHSHEAVQELKKFLNASDSQGPYAALRGNLFEGFAHTQLRMGGKFKVRNLHDNSESMLTVQQTTQENISELKFPYKSTLYCQPIVRNYAAVDSWICPIGFFQMTVSPTHSIVEKKNERIS